MKKMIMVMGVAAVFAATAGQWSKPTWIPREKGLYRSQIHRGGGTRSRPDNSLETFLWCWGRGFAPEADARLAKDGVVRKGTALVLDHIARTLWRAPVRAPRPFRMARDGMRIAIGARGRPHA